MTETWMGVYAVANLAFIKLRGVRTHWQT